MGEVDDKIYRMIAEQLEVPLEQVTASSRFIEDLGADSLDVVELIMTLEEEFDIDIPDDDAQQLATVGAAVDYVSERVAG